MRACVEPDSCGCLFISALHAASHSAVSVPAPHLLLSPRHLGSQQGGQGSWSRACHAPAPPSGSRAGAQWVRRTFPICGGCGAAGGGPGPSLILCGRLLLAREEGDESGCEQHLWGHVGAAPAPGPRQGPQRRGQSGP